MSESGSIKFPVVFTAAHYNKNEQRLLAVVASFAVVGGGLSIPLLRHFGAYLPFEYELIRVSIIAAGFLVAFNTLPPALGLTKVQKIEIVPPWIIHTPDSLFGLFKKPVTYSIGDFDKLVLILDHDGAGGDEMGRQGAMYSLRLAGNKNTKDLILKRLTHFEKKSEQKIVNYAKELGAAINKPVEIKSDA